MPDCITPPASLNYLVVGGSGKTGRRVVDRLTDLGFKVGAVSRSTDPAFDWEHPQGWAGAIRGADAIYVTYHPDLALPEAAGRVAELAALAAQQGVQRFVLLSGRGEPGAQDAERRVLATLPLASVVRTSWFFQNFSENFMRDGVLAGEIALPVGDVREPFIDADDIADVAVRLLTQPGYEGQVCEVTGPEAMTFTQACAEISAAIGRPVRFRQIGLDEFRAGLDHSGAPEDLVRLMEMLFTEVLDGRNVETTTGVQSALGRAPRSLRTFAEAAARTGAWPAP